MATIKSYTDIEQSKKLAEILPLESADMYYEWHNKKVCFKDDKYNEMDFSCWSLTALLSVLPVTATLIKDGTIANIGDVKYSCECSMVTIHKWFDNPIDACVAMIEKLHELNLL